VAYQLKKGVDIRFLRQEIVRYLPNIEGIFHVRAPGIPLVITSGAEGKHGENSKHYRNGAVDIRKRQLNPAQLIKIKNDLKKLLGDDFDIVEESTHIHIEYDP